MAQLRDAHTGELVFEGTPLEVAALANEIGVGEILFDDVGEGFDHAAVVKRFEEDAKGLEAVAKDKDAGADVKKSASARAKEIRDAITSAKKAKARTTKAIADARDRREKAMKS